jgi:hypothetical protein
MSKYLVKYRKTMYDNRTPRERSFSTESDARRFILYVQRRFGEVLSLQQCEGPIWDMAVTPAEQGE